MFIPKGEPLYENLATSYILVDALIDDLCEGGFSGLVEIVLRDVDAHVVVDQGRVVAALERQSGADYTRASISRLAQMSRRERGRVSVYRYSKGVAAALAGRITAQPLYTGLSSDFTDLNKMIVKFRRESDREWFIGITTVSGITSLVHIEDDRCRIITSGAEQDVVESGQLDIAANSSLRALLEECNSAGGTFDVYFRRVGESYQEVGAEEYGDAEPIKGEVEPEPEEIAVADESNIDHLQSSASAAAAGASTESVYRDEPPSFPPFISEPASQISVDELQIADDELSKAEEPVEEADVATDAAPTVLEESAGGLSAATRRLLAMPQEMQVQPADYVTQSPSEAEEMAESKRLMGEIARTVEEAVKAIEQGDSFSMSLRAGQLKVADQYPFLDPFGSEFEYMEGEIVFVGKTTPAEFVTGLTEAIKLAVANLMQSSQQPSRLRAFITEDLNRLLERNLAEFQRYKLDRVIEEILNF